MQRVAKICAVCSLALGAPGAALAAELTDLQLATIVQASRRAGTPLTYESILATISRPIRVFDVGHDGLDKGDFAKIQKFQDASARVPTLAAFLSADLDNDQRVTREEFDFASRGNMVLAFRTTAFVTRDLNGDGVLDWAELSAPPQPDEPRNFDPSGGLTNLLQDLAPRSDGTFTMDDATRLASQVLSRLDSDRNGLLSENELRIQRQLAFQGPPQAAAVCTLPRPQAEQEIVRIGAYEGVALSNVHLGDPDKKTAVVTVTIEPGESQLYVVASSYRSVIWRFEGATTRIGQVAIGGYEAQGVTGVEKAKVFIAPARECISVAHDFSSVRGLVAKNETSHSLGKPVAFAGGAYALEAIAVPSMKTAQPREPRKGATAPIVEIEPSAVVAAKPAAAYDLLPGRAGVAKLVQDGKLIPIGQDSYKIVGPFPRFPAELSGADRMTFVLGAGVPAPEGDVGQSCLVRETDGEPLRNGMFCRRQ